METLRKVVAALVAITACLLYAHASHAVAPVQKGQAPGYYRMMLGDFEIVALSDGTVALEVRKLLTNTTPTRVDQLLMRSFLADPVETSVNGPGVPDPPRGAEPVSKARIPPSIGGGCARAREIGLGRLPGRDSALLRHPPLRTVRDSFPSHGSSLYKGTSRHPVQQLHFLGGSSCLDCSRIAFTVCGCSRLT